MFAALLKLLLALPVFAAPPAQKMTKTFNSLPYTFELAVHPLKTNPADNFADNKDVVLHVRQGKKALTKLHLVELNSMAFDLSKSELKLERKKTLDAGTAAAFEFTVYQPQKCEASGVCITGRIYQAFLLVMEKRAELGPAMLDTDSDSGGRGELKLVNGKYVLSYKNQNQTWKFAEPEWIFEEMQLGERELKKNHQLVIHATVGGTVDVALESKGKAIARKPLPNVNLDRAITKTPAGWFENSVEFETKPSSSKDTEFLLVSLHPANPSIGTFQRAIVAVKKDDVYPGPTIATVHEGRYIDMDFAFLKKSPPQIPIRVELSEDELKERPKLKVLERGEDALGNAAVTVDQQLWIWKGNGFDRKEYFDY